MLHALPRKPCNTKSRLQNAKVDFLVARIVPKQRVAVQTQEAIMPTPPNNQAGSKHTFSLYQKGAYHEASQKSQFEGLTPKGIHILDKRYGTLKRCKSEVNAGNNAHS
jgi:hypothetical protein